MNVQQRLKRGATVFALMVFVFPASNNYQMRDFAWGAGGTSNSESEDYRLNAAAGELSEMALTGEDYGVWPGLQFTQTSNVPPAPTLTNDSNYYNRLNLEIATGDNPSDTLYAVAISTDNFTTTEFLQSDNTVGPTLGPEDWQTYSNWGSGSGEFIVGLAPGTTYSVKVKAKQGAFSEGPWGPSASAATSSLTLSFDIDVAATDTESSAPYDLALGTLTPGSITTATNRVWVDLSTNADQGGGVYLFSSNTGLYSTATDYLIAAVTGNLSALTEGFGVQSVSVAQSSGGPMGADAPFNGSSEVVGTLTVTPQRIFNTSATPITSGRASFLTKVKPSTLAPAATDYTEVLTIVAAANF